MLLIKADLVPWVLKKMIVVPVMLSLFENLLGTIIN